jgi:hypothetical protein
VTVKIKEEQYAIGLRGEPSSKLQTANIQTCIAFSGINREKGVAFLCHINSPCGASKILPVLVADLKERGLSINDFNLYTSIGVSPWLVTLATAAVLASIGLHVISLAPWVVLLGAGLVSLIYWNLKPIGLWFALSCMRVVANHEFLGYEFHLPGRRRCRVSVDANPADEQSPVVETYFHVVSDCDYTPPSSGNQKADGSA